MGGAEPRPYAMNHCFSRSQPLTRLRSDPAGDAPEQPNHHGVGRPRTLLGLRRRRGNGGHTSLVEGSEPARREVSRPPRGPAAAAVQGDVIGLDDRAVADALAVRRRGGAERDRRDEVGVVHLPEELRLSGASPEPARVHRPGTEASVPGQLVGGCLGRQAEDHVQVLGGELAERHSRPAQGHTREGVVVAPENAPVCAHVGAVERVAQRLAQPSRSTAIRLAGEHDQLAEAEPLDLVHGGLVPAANVALVEHDADPKMVPRRHSPVRA